ncbi:hypothetical protein KP509_23G039100 [Ceratopteris richardii]|uniref:DUF641 domain-containing protein n=1 Tax=Ceratopteris richardii TaxID=49495 RepID=A0A8T2RZK5_CERRI|nr:hypothetical protein KP509_23G039100 [Ceratopteris richardii]
MMGDQINGLATHAKLVQRCRNFESILQDAFASISSLREAWSLAQSSSLDEDAATPTHVRSGAAQGRVVSRELKKLAELQHRYKWRADNSSGTCSPDITCASVQRAFIRGPGQCEVSEKSRYLDGFESEESIGNLKRELQRRDMEITNLICTVERLISKKEKLERRVRKLSDRLKEAGQGSGHLTAPMTDKIWDRLNEISGAMPADGPHGLHLPDEEGRCKRLSSRGRENGSAGNRSAVVNAAQAGNLGRAGSRKLRCGRGDADQVGMKEQSARELQALFDRCVAEVDENVTVFSKATALLMKKAGWRIEEGGVEWVMEGHKALAVQSYVCMNMFRGFESEDFYMSGRLRWLLDPAAHRQECRQQFEAMSRMVEEPLDLLAGVAPDSAFGSFCRKKFLHIMPEPMEEALLGDLRHRNCLLGAESGGPGGGAAGEAAHPHWSRFYRCFVRMAKAVWTLHRLAFSVEPRIRAFRAEEGEDFLAGSMISQVPDVELAEDTPNLLPKVAFPVMPGFRMGDTILLKCRVYLNGMKLSSPVCSRAALPSSRKARNRQSTQCNGHVDVPEI